VKRAEPLSVLWWLVSRASGVVALVLFSLAVLMGLAMAAKVLRVPAHKRLVMRLHEHVALAALAALAAHGLALLGDTWLKPGLRGIAVPFALSYRPTFTGIGIIAGYLAILVGPSFYVRRRLGARRWRRLHRASVLVWGMGAVHALGSGSDAEQLWLRIVVLAPVVPLAYLLVLRLLPESSAARQRRQAGTSSQPVAAKSQAVAAKSQPLAGVSSASS
jgi:sulfoxide reductase heme-binding subunit YedZ